MMPTHHITAICVLVLCFSAVDAQADSCSNAGPVAPLLIVQNPQDPIPSTQKQAATQGKTPFIANQRLQDLDGPYQAPSMQSVDADRNKPKPSARVQADARRRGRFEPGYGVLMWMPSSQH